VAEVLTSPLVFGLLRRRFGERAGYLLGFMWYWLAWGLLSPFVGCRATCSGRDTESTSPPRARAARDPAWRRWRDPPAGALAAAGLGSLGDADVTEIAISVAVATVNSAAA
jgi:hypothetical protein